MSKPTDVQVTAVRVFLVEAPMRVPLKFGAQTVTEVTCARVGVRVVDRAGREVEGWGETPLSVAWGWPSPLPYHVRLQGMLELTRSIASAWVTFGASGHALELGWDFIESRLPELWRDLNTERGGEAMPWMPWLAALITASPFDLALHDAFGKSAGAAVYTTYGSDFLSRDLATFLEPASGTAVSFRGRYPQEFLSRRRDHLRAWHLVGGLDAVAPGDLRGDEPKDGYPVLLEDWIRRDQLRCLKVKLRGDDAEWDYHRLVEVGTLADRLGVDWLSADFNCTVRTPEVVNGVLDRVRDERPRIYGMLLYVEQPFPYELEAHPLEVHSVSARKPLFLDESAHDWRSVRLGRSLGWTGVALKTCKTQSGALLSLCWARAHGMSLMVQDLTNPMLAQVSHLLLAAHADTIMGVETNAMQFYPEVSLPEAAIHPGCYRRREGEVNLESVRGAGFGYRLDEIHRPLPQPFFAEGDTG